MNPNEEAAIAGIANILDGKPADPEPVATPTTPEPTATPKADPPKSTEAVEPVATPEQAPEPETPAEADETTEEPEAEQAPEVEADEEPALDWTQFLPQVKAPEPDEDGNVDVGQLVQHQVAEALRQANAEQQAWEAASRELPEIKTNPTVREFVLNQRIADIANGGDGDIMKATSAIKAVIGGARAEGKTQAQTSVTVQKAAALETGGGTNPNAADNPNAQLMERINNGDTGAAEEMLANWIDQGII